MSEAQPPKEVQPSKPAADPTKPWRVWIPLVLLLLMFVARVIPDLLPNPPANVWVISAFGPLLASLGILLWLALVSRARWWERLMGVISIVLILVAITAFSDASTRGPIIMVMTIPMTLGGFALGAILFGRTLNKNRLWYSLAIAALLSSATLFVKTDGAWGNFQFGIQPRWSPTAEDRLLAERSAQSSHGESAKNAPINDTAAEAFLHPEWPGLRGPNFDGAQHGVRFSDDWKAHPPKELWRIAVGPAWCSFAVASPFLVTQEQRGELEYVVCYDADTGKEVWAHSDKGRFFDPLGGLGPRATPTIHEGSIYALAADGKLLKLDAKNGDVVWSANLEEVAKIKAPMWGFSSSPVVHDGKVIVYAGNESAPEGHIFAFDVASGDVAWNSPAGKMSYSSVQPLDVLGTTFLALLSEVGLHLFHPDTGEVALTYKWPHSGYRALQPQVVDDDKIVIPTGLGTGTRLVHASMNDNTPELEELWTSLDMKSDFNDMVVHKGYAYGFDDRIFSCISLKDGKRKWKGGRYEKGQAILLADSDLIIVVSEKGDLVLLRATPDKLQELAKIPAMHGKTWNHPVVVGNRLYIRNPEEAVCYELATVEPPKSAEPPQDAADEAKESEEASN